MITEISCEGHKLTVRLPADSYTIRDTLDRLRLYDCTDVKCKVTGCDADKTIEGLELSGDIYLINTLAKRLESRERDMQDRLAVVKAMLKKDPDRDLTNLIKATYAKGELPVYRCGKMSEYAALVIENHWLEEIKNVPEQAIPFIDRQAVLRAMITREKGVFVDDHYVRLDDYTEPDVEISVSRYDDSFFRLLIALRDSDPDISGQWISLPQEYDKLAEVAQCCGVETDELQIIGFESVLPRAEPPSTVSIRSAEEYQEAAVKLGELTHRDILKLKAVMESSAPMSVWRIIELTDNLNRYEFISDTEDEGNEALVIVGGVMTPYGIISGLDQKIQLTSSQEQTSDEQYGHEDEAESEDESEDMGMGVIS